MKVVRSNGEPVWSSKSLIKNPSTRLRFSIWVIVANFLLGIIGMVLGSDLTALGVFLGLSNAPLYAYILGRSFRPSQVPDEYFNQSHGGAGGLGGVLSNINQNNQVDQNQVFTQPAAVNIPTQSNDKSDMPIEKESNKPIKVIKKDPEDIG